MNTCPFASVWCRVWLAWRPMMVYFKYQIINILPNILTINNEINTFLSVSIRLLQSLVGTITTGLLLPCWPLRIILSCAFSLTSLFNTSGSNQVWGLGKWGAIIIIIIIFTSIITLIASYSAENISFLCIFPDRSFISDLSSIFDLSFIYKIDTSDISDLFLYLTSLLSDLSLLSQTSFLNIWPLPFISFNTRTLTGCWCLPLLS